MAELPPGAPDWWRNAVVYQVYVRSFTDTNGDGTGDLGGVVDRLPYLRDLGVDALWFNPWYPSPMADSGYDVIDYRAIDPQFGTLAQAEQLIEQAADLGIRTIIDIVPNHVSNQHPWFLEALAAEPGSAQRARFWFRAGAGHDGELAPNNWQSIFGGPAWTRTKDADGRPGEWYLHLFAPEQPDLNWTHRDVWREHEDVLRFWFDRGVAGIRIDSAALLVKDPRLVDDSAQRPAADPHPFTDRDDLHEIYRGWRRLADTYPEPRVLVGEVWLPDPERFARYLRADELHTAFNFDFMSCPWDAAALRASIDGTLAAHEPVGAPATWVLANHDVTRTVTRYGRADTSFSFQAKREGTPTDLALGNRRARAAALLTMALPGSLYIYQGEELGLPEVEDIPADRRQDPMYFRSGGIDPGRDGCRVPLPWRGTEPPYGFSPVADHPTWLDQPGDWARYTVAAQSGDPASMLSLYRTGLHLRHSRLAFGDGFAWLPSPPNVLAFTRGRSLACFVNFGAAPVELPENATILLASGPLDGGRLPEDTAVWLDWPRPRSTESQSRHPHPQVHEE
ncbi:MAG TPA: glycoside hydrolase family 13 protein [Jatrophihabitans sp.]|nr:glycoside hydrolase family 13 protein [Jatrophihabitans sp.]